MIIPIETKNRPPLLYAGKKRKTEIVNAAYVPVVFVFSFGGKLLQYR
jgi:hypothetical protein